jgi:lipopolysaccharide transport system ATP-binding protein
MTHAIVVEGVAKSYSIRHEGRERYTALRDVIASKVKSAFSRQKRKYSSSSEEFWALEDVSFAVDPGERLGIIGRNGAGKSTLLKILSRITEPTRGRIRIAGRVASLLEVGTGFHPELTGRENIFLNGVILGMTRAEVRRRFDEIVAFAEVEKFLDTPVKRYSSGMYVRLAFAVAAHLETEVMIVDEVLAVGDAAFQEKCLTKMQDVATGGRTVLFVSHNLSAVRHLCNRSLLLERGRVVIDSTAEHTIGEYERRVMSPPSDDLGWERRGSGRARLSSIEISDARTGESGIVPFDGSLRIALRGRGGLERTSFELAMQAATANGMPVLYHFDQFRLFTVERDAPFEIHLILDNIRLMPDTYVVNIWLGRTGIEDIDYVRFGGSFRVVPTSAIRATAPIDQSLGYVIHEGRVDRLA